MAWPERNRLSASLIVAGWTMLVMGIFLLLVKLLMVMAEVAGGAIALVGLILLAAGLAMQRR